MRIFSYRNKHILRRVLLTLLIAVLVVLALVIGRFLYLQRFVVYENGGAHLDYSQRLEPTGSAQTASGSGDYSFETIVEADSSAQQTQQTLPSVSGVYISTAMLLKGTDAVQAALDAAGSYNTVMIDVKSIYGNFYYSTGLSGASVATDGVDVTAIDALIAKLAQQKDLDLIARVPAFTDSNYALAHQSEGLPLSSGALWTDSSGCYWLNPGSGDVQDHLVAIGTELQRLGFDEVLYDDFYFPDSTSIVWSDSSLTKEDAVTAAAKAVSSGLDGTGIRVCFGSQAPAVAACADRVVIASEDASAVQTLVESLKSSLQDTGTQIVFLTSSRDTRFAVCGVLRPLMEDTE